MHDTNKTNCSLARCPLLVLFKNYVLVECKKDSKKGPQLFKYLKWKGKDQAYYFSQNQGLW